MRLWHRIFLACAGLAVLSLAGYVAWQQLSFARGFADYLDRIALERAAQAAPRLADHYRRSGDWSFLQRDPMLLGMLIDERGPRPAHHPGAMPPPPARPPHDPSVPAADARSRIPHGDALRDRPPGPPALDFGRRLRLIDTQGQFIAGARGPQSALPDVPVELDGVPVGTIQISALPDHLRGSPEGDFSRMQMRMAAIAALVVLLAALGLAWSLSRWLLRPVNDLAAGTQALAAGDYARRVPVRGRDELARLASDFNRMAESLERHRDDRRRWGQDIAHELRTPLTILHAELQTLIEGVRATTPDALSSLLAECERLSRLVDELHELSMADQVAQSYRFESLDLRELIEVALDTQQGGLAAAGLQVLWTPPSAPLTVRGDARRLAQLLDNLLLNAARYTDSPGQIQVTLTQADGQARLSIADSAPGVGDADLPLLFERLYRADRSRSRARGGSGLGLAICRAIVEAHGGRIAAAHSPLGGLEIVVTLPLQEVQA